MSRGFHLAADATIQLEVDAQDIAVDVPGTDAKSPQFARVSDVGTAAWAGVVVAHRNDANGVTGILRNTLQVES